MPLGTLYPRPGDHQTMVRLCFLVEHLRLNKRTTLPEEHQISIILEFPSPDHGQQREVLTAPRKKTSLVVCIPLAKLGAAGIQVSLLEEAKTDSVTPLYAVLNVMAGFRESSNETSEVCFLKLKCQRFQPRPPGVQKKQGKRESDDDNLHDAGADTKGDDSPLNSFAIVLRRGNLFAKPVLKLIEGDDDSPLSVRTKRKAPSVDDPRVGVNGQVPVHLKAKMTILSQAFSLLLMACDPTGQTPRPPIPSLASAITSATKVTAKREALWPSVDGVVTTEPRRVVPTDKSTPLVSSLLERNESGKPGRRHIKYALMSPADGAGHVMPIVDLPVELRMTPSGLSAYSRQDSPLYLPVGTWSGFHGNEFVVGNELSPETGAAVRNHANASLVEWTPKFAQKLLQECFGVVSWSLADVTQVLGLIELNLQRKRDSDSDLFALLELQPHGKFTTEAHNAPNRFKKARYSPTPSEEEPPNTRFQLVRLSRGFTTDAVQLHQRPSKPLSSQPAESDSEDSEDSEDSDSGGFDGRGSVIPLDNRVSDNRPRLSVVPALILSPFAFIPQGRPVDFAHNETSTDINDLQALLSTRQDLVPLRAFRDWSIPDLLTLIGFEFGFRSRGALDVKNPLFTTNLSPGQQIFSVDMHKEVPNSLLPKSGVRLFSELNREFHKQYTKFEPV